MKRILPYVNLILSSVFIIFTKDKGNTTEYMSCLGLAFTILYFSVDSISYKKKQIRSVLLIVFSAWLLSTRIYSFLTTNDWTNEVIISNVCYIFSFLVIFAVYLLELFDINNGIYQKFLYAILCSLVVSLFTAFNEKDVMMFCVIALTFSITITAFYERLEERTKEISYDDTKKDN